MTTHADKTPEPANRAIGETVSLGEGAMALTDHRPQAAQLKALVDAAAAASGGTHRLQGLGRVEAPEAAAAGVATAQLMKIHTDVHKLKKYVDLEPGERKKFEERYKLETGQEMKLSASQVVAFDTIAGQSVEFKSTEEFMGHLNKLVTDWGGQKFFYETPQHAKGGKKEIKERAPLAGQSADTNIKLYSARGAADVQSLFNWASANSIPTEGFDDYEAGDALDAPMKGHFGDRIHTIKHLRQKGGAESKQERRDDAPEAEAEEDTPAAGAQVICLHLNAAGTREVKAVRNDPNFIKAGGEGASAGGFGLKSENNFISVALGKSKATWDHMKGRIALIQLVGAGAAPAEPVVEED